MTREEAIQMLKALNMMLRRPDGTPISDACDALDMAIEALQTETVRCKDCKHGEKQKTYEEVKFYSCDFSETEEWFTEDFFCANGERREP